MNTIFSKINSINQFQGKDTEDNGSSGIESTVREYERQLSNQNRKKEQIKKEEKELNKKIEKAEKVKTSFSSEWKKKSQKLAML